MGTVILVNFIFFNFFYMFAVFKKDFSVIDIAWGPSFFLTFMTTYFAIGETLDLRTILVGIFVFVWALRLSTYIFSRSLKTKSEDPRYAQWRRDWGSQANIIAYFKVFTLQCILSLVIASPLYFIQVFPPKESFGEILDFVGIAFWCLGFMFEAIGDYQKNKFKNDPANKGKIMQEGLWRYTRHPNYFGEVMLWWGIFFIVINTVPVYLAFVGPLLLNFLIVKVSGVALTEKAHVGNPIYEKYQLTTNSLLPWFPKDLK